MHDAQDLKRANDAVTGGGEIAENDMATLFAAEIQFLVDHFFKYIAITHLRAHNLSPARCERFIKANIAHYSGDDRVLSQPASLKKIQSCDGEDLVAIDDLAVLVAQKNAIRVAIMGDADIRAADLHKALDLLRMHAAAAVVNVHSIRLVVRHGYIRA